MLLLYLAIIAALIWVLPYFRIFIKRLLLWHTLHRFCKKYGYTLYGTHRLWMFGSNAGHTCDVYIYTGRHLYSIKLFALKYRRSTLIFSEGHQYHVRYYLGLVAQAASARLPIDGSVKHMPQYRFRKQINSAWETAVPHAILLLNPVCHEIYQTQTFAGRKEERLLGIGDRVNDMQLYSLHRLLERIALDMRQDKETRYPNERIKQI